MKKSIYFDVGSWQSHEKGKPTMTFGLIEHNAIALCSYFSDGQESFHIPSKVGNQKYNFQMSLINQFLTIMMNNKYGKSVRHYQYETTPKKYHIRGLIPFPSKSLLEDDGKLIILIPDLHLHFFKDSYLDNFVTYYESRWDRGRKRPDDKRTGKRQSMEKEFGILLQTITEYQKKVDYNIEVITLGDTYEMWETQIIFDYFCIKGMTFPDVYKHLKSEISKARDAFGNVKKYGNILEQLYRFKIHEKATDQIFKKQIDALKKTTIGKDLYIKEGDCPKRIWTKASKLEDEILKKYVDRNGTTFNDLFREIANLDRLHGNHDNYFVLKNLNPILGIGDVENGEDEKQIEPYKQTKQSKIFIHHGHYFDESNNDVHCKGGYLLTGFNALFEAKKHGDYFKQFEKVVRSGREVRDDYIKKTCGVFQYSSQPLKLDPKEKKKPKSEFNIMVHAHTHEPCLQNITSKCR